MSLKFLPLVHVLLATFGGVVAFGSNPDYYVWLLLPLVFFAVAYKSLVSPGSRKVLIFSFFAIALYSFAIGRLFYQRNALTDDGLVLLIATLPIAAFAVIRICVVEVKLNNDSLPDGS